MQARSWGPGTRLAPQSRRRREVLHCLHLGRASALLPGCSSHPARWCHDSTHSSSPCKLQRTLGEEHRSSRQRRCKAPTAQGQLQGLCRSRCCAKGSGSVPACRSPTESSSARSWSCPKKGQSTLRLDTLGICLDVFSGFAKLDVRRLLGPLPLGIVLPYASRSSKVLPFGSNWLWLVDVFITEDFGSVPSIPSLRLLGCCGDFGSVPSVPCLSM